MIKNYLISLYANAMDRNDKNIYDSLRKIREVKNILDVGCWDGKKTVLYAEAIGAKEVYGIEIVPEKAKEAEAKGIRTHSLLADRDRWPFEDGSLDCVVSNQVIEHLSDIDFFLSEASRVLKKGGYFITSTNNLSSWHNIFAIIMGWAPFDLTNSSKKANGIGNPLAIHKGETIENGDSWTHKTVLNARWMNDWFKLYGFEGTETRGSGYYPFPSLLGKWLVRHSAFITLASKKIL